MASRFTLLPDEMALLDNKVGVNRLGFAVLLKFFQLEARFPRSRQEIPKPIVSYIARQLELSPNSFREYEWQGCTSVRHRVEIREFFGFRESTQQDAQLLKEWLCQSVLIYDRQESHLETIVCLSTISGTEVGTSGSRPSETVDSLCCSHR